MGDIRFVSREGRGPPAKAVLRCYAELNDFLTPDRRYRDMDVPLDAPTRVGGLVAGLGIPADGVELVLVNGTSCGLNRTLRDGDRVSLYPMFEVFDVTSLLRLRQRPLRRVRFVADAHLGRLARYLRLLGFDTLFENDRGDLALVKISAEEGRILLSRDQDLLARRAVTHGVRVPPEPPRAQLTFVVERLDLYGLFRPFTRCTVCNATLKPVAKSMLEMELPSRVRDAFDTFRRCAGCGRIYWEGSHYDHLRAFIDQILAERAGRGRLVPE